MTLELTVHLDGDRDRARRRARGHAAVAEPARLGRELALHLVLPRHPVLVQILLWYNIAALYPRFSLGIPFGGPQFVHFNANVADHAVRRRRCSRSG